MIATAGLTRQDLVAAALWFVVIVPPAFGFWLVAGDLAGVPPQDLRALMIASMLAIGVATLLQVTIGYLVPVYEGPAGNYLAAIAVLAISNPSPAEMTGGLLIAGAVVFGFGALRVDRTLGRLFTPPVVHAFLFLVVILAAPPTVERALAIGSDGSEATAAWASAAVVAGFGVGLQRARRFRAYALLIGLLLGTLTYFAVAGVPRLEVRSAGINLPSLFPWGEPRFSLSIAAPFVIAAVLASFNTIASMRVMSEAVDQPLESGSGRRGLLVDGGAQAANACIGNVLGHVPRLDAGGVVALIHNTRGLTLGLAAAATIVLALAGPVVDLLVLLPIPVSASLLTVVLGAILVQGARAVSRMSRRSRWLVIAPAIAPAPVWLAFAAALSETAQLLTNPLLIGVVLAISLDHLIPPSALEGRG